jgi:acetyltransferase
MMTQNFLSALTVRAARPNDVPVVAALLGGLSQRSLNLRYLIPLPHLSSERALQEAQRLCGGESGRITLLAFVEAETAAELVGLAELVSDRADRGVAEVAIVVADQYQRAGIGSVLSQQIAAFAPSAQIHSIRAYSLPHNHAVRRLFARSGRPFRSDTRQGMTCYQLRLI